MTSIFGAEQKYRVRRVWRKWSKAFIQVTVSLLIAFGTLFIWNRPEGVVVNQWLLRHFFEFRGPRPPPAEVLLVAIDDETYGRLRASTNFPLPRRFIAQALEQIIAAKPKAVVLDATIPPEPTRDPASDARIEAALRSGPTTICSGELPRDPENPASEGLVLGSDDSFRRAATMELPMIVFGTEGVISYISFSRSTSSSLYERAPIARALVELAGLPVSPPGVNDLIDFYGPAGTIPRLPLFELLSAGAGSLKEELQGRVVLMGYQSVERGRGTLDKDEFYTTASSKPMFGVEVHANIIGNLLDHSWLRRTSLENERNTLFLAVFLLAGAGLWMNPRRSAPAICAVTAGSVALAYLAFSRLHVWWTGIGPLLLSAVVTLVATALFHISRTERFRKYLDETFRFKFDREM